MHATKLSTAALGLATTTALVTGCASSSADSPSSPHPTTSASSSQPRSLPGHGAPKVADPINDTAKFHAAPCAVLAAAQLAALGKVGEGRPGPGEEPTCHWEADRFSFTITAVTAAPLGLSTIYQEQPHLGLFQPVDPIQGHPAILYGKTNRLKEGAAGLAIGITDRVAYQVDLTISSGPDMAQPDKMAEQIADLMITTMKRGG